MSDDPGTPPGPGDPIEDVEAELAALFASPPEDFVATRDALAARARRSGDRTLAQRVKGLRRPTASAWVANLLARAEPGRVAELVELGAALRAAHRELSAEELRPLAARRTEVVEALTRRAARLAAEHGRRTTEAVRAEVAGTLHAAMADPAVAAELCAARLSRPASHSGFGLDPDPSAAGSPAVVNLDQARHRRADRRGRDAEEARTRATAEARRRLEAAGTALTEARAALSEAEESHLEAAEELDRRSQEVADLRGELEQAEDAEQQAQDTASRAQLAVGEAETGVTAAEADQQRAQQELDAASRP